MKTLQEYSEDIYKCTRCGLCQSVCPVFEATGKESTVSRGQLTLLNGIINGQIKFTKNLSKNLDLCLRCNACHEFCPSGISICDIITAARYENYKLNGHSLIKNLNLVFNSKFSLNFLKFGLNIFRQLPKNIASIINSQLKEHIQYKNLSPAKPVSQLKIAYFPGCVNTYINQSIKNAVMIVLERNGLKAEIPKNLSCCGIPARNSGNMDEFIKLAKNNLAKISPDIDYLITDCASCGTVWKIYEDILEGNFKEKAKILADKAVNINKFLMLSDIYIPENAQINKSVTYHDPCHLKRSQGIHNEPREILKLIPGIEFKEMDSPDSCCGAAGMFCMTHPEISKAISGEKAQNIINSGAEIISTSCPSCKIGISQGLAQFNRQLPVYSPVELLAEVYLREIYF